MIIPEYREPIYFEGDLWIYLLRIPVIASANTCEQIVYGSHQYTTNLTQFFNSLGGCR